MRILRAASLSTFFIVVSLLICLFIPGGTSIQSEDILSKIRGAQSDGINQNQISLHLSKEHATDRLIVKYNPNQFRTKSAMMSVQSATNEDAGSSVIKDLSSSGIPGMQVVQVTNTTLEDAMKTYEANPDVLYVEPDYKIALSPIEKIGKTMDIPNVQADSSTYPNDPGYQYLWGLHNTGQVPFNGIINADINAPAAWGVTTGSPGIIVAVVDTGVDYSHPDLAANIWQNPGEIPNNGIDDDGNGYVDDVRGWNFVAKNNDPMDDNGHGSHCAGTIAAIGNNGVGVTGVTWNSKIMPLKFLDSQGGGYVSDAISAILYASKMGAPIISNSWSGTGDSQSLKDAIDASSALIVCAAGNSGANSDVTPQYPAAYTNNNIISVAASNYNDKLASFSNYGVNSVDLAAPGVSIYSTTKSGEYKYLNGTSMATPYVTGVAALIKSQNPSMTATQIKSKILDNCDILSSLSGKVATGGRLNAAKAIGISAPTPTPTPTPLPTSIPTPTPTPIPTSIPTPTPTPIPTSIPTPVPTPIPTSIPTPVPTPIPTSIPTPVPTPSTGTPFPTPYVTPVPHSTDRPTWYPTPHTPEPPIWYPTPRPTQNPPSPQTPCGIYKTDTQSGYLRTGQAAVYGYYIPPDGRSRIEWSMSSYGSCDNGNVPIIPAASDMVSGESSICKGSSTFDLYVFKDCNPKDSYCNTRYYSSGPNSYISINSPSTGSIYYVMVYARNGIAGYNLIMNSYKCSDNTPVIVASAESGKGKDTGSGPEVSAPTADFVVIQ